MKSISEKTFQIIIRSEIITIIMKIFLKQPVWISLLWINQRLWIIETKTSEILEKLITSLFSAIIIVDKSGEKCE